VEWDAQGQLIFLIAEYYRYTGDRERLAAWYPQARAAAEFLVELREETADNPPPTRGILPPSKSAEDLGPEEWHHYWDNFWAVAGLENGAYLARQLGRMEEARWMAAEADALRRDLRASIEAVMGPAPAYIPNGPEDVISSAMARGSANSLYPVEVFSRDDPLIVRSFDVYYEKWIAPQNGGFKHIYGQWWPYGGLGLARDYLRLGRHDILHQILGWTLQHQTLPGTFAWAEQVNPATKGFSGGDMPHAWAASSYVTLLREMLLMRDGEALELFAGVPGSWLEAGEVVGVYEAATPFGPVTAVTDSALTVAPEQWQGTLTVTVGGAAPPDGFRWRLPRLPARVDGPPGTELDGDWLLIPSGGGEVTLVYGG
jgi:GH15 family glucan-1,4-alpha-glucosidase